MAMGLHSRVVDESMVASVYCLFSTLFGAYLFHPFPVLVWLIVIYCLKLEGVRKPCDFM
jgi:hypothetical protein